MMMNQKKIDFVFFGTPEIAVHALEELENAGFLPNLVVTMPEKAQGRGLEFAASPVALWGQQHGIEILSPEKIDGPFLYRLQEKAYDVFIVVAYGKILPRVLLDIPKHGVLNLHPSLLPRLRGPSPIRSAILTDEKETGVTIMQLDEKMDHGPILVQKKILATPWPPHAIDLEETLAREGGQLLAQVLPEWVAGKVDAQLQDDTKATYCTKIEKKDGEIDIVKGAARENLLKIRGLEGWPGTFTFFERGGQRIRVGIIDAHIENDALVIDLVKPEGKKEMPYKEFQNSGAKPV